MVKASKDKVGMVLMTAGDDDIRGDVAPHKYQKWIYKIRLLLIVPLIISVVLLNLSQIF